MVIIMSKLINLQDVMKSYYTASGEVTILNHVDLTVDKGEFVAILGRSGSGKSTLLNILGFMDRRFTGTYEFLGKSVHDYNDRQLSQIRNENVGFVFQDFSLLEKLTVFQNVSLPFAYTKTSKDAIKKRVATCLEMVGLSEFADQKVSFLSGGQRQRVAIARSLVMSPEFIIADEPTGALDSRTAKDIMTIFSQLHQQGVTIILVTHDESLTAVCDRVIRIRDGVVT
jgi:putative ABC transport system ATP-binding protein